MLPASENSANIEKNMMNASSTYATISDGLYNDVPYSFNKIELSTCGANMLKVAKLPPSLTSSYCCNTAVAVDGKSITIVDTKTGETRRYSGNFIDADICSEGIVAITPNTISIFSLEGNHIATYGKYSGIKKYLGVSAQKTRATILMEDDDGSARIMVFRTYPRGIVKVAEYSSLLRSDNEELIHARRAEVWYDYAVYWYSNTPDVAYVLNFDFMRVLPPYTSESFTWMVADEIGTAPSTVSVAFTSKSILVAVNSKKVLVIKYDKVNELFSFMKSLAKVEDAQYRAQMYKEFEESFKNYLIFGDKVYRVAGAPHAVAFTLGTPSSRKFVARGEGWGANGAGEAVLVGDSFVAVKRGNDIFVTNGKKSATIGNIGKINDARKNCISGTNYSLCFF